MKGKIIGLDLETASLQDVFDFVVFKLIQQGRPSFDLSRGLCVYRGPENARCAVGHIIPDDEYTLRCEENSISSLLRTGFAPPSLKALVERLNAEQFFFDLQSAHDLTNRQNWIMDFRASAREVARKHSLDASIVAYREGR